MRVHLDGRQRQPTEHLGGQRVVPQRACKRRRHGEHGQAGQHGEDGQRPQIRGRANGSVGDPVAERRLGRRDHRGDEPVRGGRLVRDRAPEILELGEVFGGVGQVLAKDILHPCGAGFVPRPPGQDAEDVVVAVVPQSGLAPEVMDDQPGADPRAGRDRPNARPLESLGGELRNGGRPDPRPGGQVRRRDLIPECCTHVQHAK